jgi:hypothetical protein
MKRISVYIPKAFLSALDRVSKDRGTTVAQLIRDAIYAFLKSLGALCILILVGCASVPFENWTKADTARQVVYTTTHVMDWVQTVNITHSDGKYYEAGLSHCIIGHHPEERDVNLYMVSTLALQTIIPAMLEPKYRRAWQYIWIGAEGATVAHNFSIGLTLDF